MAQNRTFTFYGIGYGSTPVNIVATVGGSQIFSGQIPTINEPIDPYPYPTPATANTTAIFSISNSADLNTDFAGNVPMSVTVQSGAGALITNITCNWMGNEGVDETGNTIYTPGSANVFLPCYGFSGPPNSEATPDCRSNVYIDGQQQVPPQPASTGTWDWRVLENQTISYNWNIAIGGTETAQGNTANYSGPFTPTPDWPPTA